MDSANIVDGLAHVEMRFRRIGGEKIRLIAPTFVGSLRIDRLPASEDVMLAFGALSRRRCIVYLR